MSLISLGLSERLFQKILVHDYWGDLDDHIIWSIITHEFLPIKGSMEELIRTETPAIFSKNTMYRLGVGLMIVNSQKKVFVGERFNKNQYVQNQVQYKAWQMPQGGIDTGEHPKQAAFREMNEEIGTNKGRIVGETTDWLQYDLPLPFQKNLVEGQFKGQKQKWFLIEFLGEDHDINLKHPAHIQEFFQWKWVEYQELINLIVDFKKDVYKKVVESFQWYFL